MHVSLLVQLDSTAIILFFALTVLRAPTLRVDLWHLARAALLATMLLLDHHLARLALLASIRHQQGRYLVRTVLLAIRHQQGRYLVRLALLASIRHQQGRYLVRTVLLERTILILDHHIAITVQLERTILILDRNIAITALLEHMLLRLDARPVLPTSILWWDPQIAIPRPQQVSCSHIRTIRQTYINQKLRM